MLRLFVFVKIKQTFDLFMNSPLPLPTFLHNVPNLYRIHQYPPQFWIVKIISKSNNYEL